MSSRTPRPHSSQPVSSIENLESRKLFASSPPFATFELVAGQIVGTGDRRHADVITVTLNTTTNQIEVNSAGGGRSFNVADVTAGVRIDGQGGDDQITVDEAITLPALLLGGKGNDTLLGGGGADSLDGGKGNDTLDGRGGSDFALGGVGRDNVKGGGDDDDLDGGAGNDSVLGDDGTDRVRGGAGRDDVSGGTGDDDVQGGKGRDRVRGDAGRDSFDSDRDQFDDRGADDNPTPRTDVNARRLPAAVLSAFDAQFAGATIREVELEQEDAGPLYQIDFFTTAGLRQRARFTPAGTLVSGGGDDNNGGGDGQHVPLDQVPAVVLSSFNARYPGATIVDVELEQENAGTVYQIDFTDNASISRRAGFTSAGTFVRERSIDGGNPGVGENNGTGGGDDGNGPGGDDGSNTGDDGGNNNGDGDGQHVALDQIPAAVLTSFNARHPGATLTSAEIEQEDAGTVYQLDFTDATSVNRLAQFTPAGTFLREQTRDDGGTGGDGDDGNPGGGDEGGNPGGGDNGNPGGGDDGGHSGGDDDNSGDGGTDDNGGSTGGDGQHVPVDQLPASVVSGFNTRYPGATLTSAEIEQEDAGTVYQLDFVDAANVNRRAEFTPVGVFVRERAVDTGAGGDGDDDNGGGNGGGNDDSGGGDSGGDGGNSGGGDDNSGSGGDRDDDGDNVGGDDNVGTGDVPAVVRSAFNGRYPNAMIREVELEREDGGPQYKFDFNDANSTRREARFTPSGAFVSERVK